MPEETRMPRATRKPTSDFSSNHSSIQAPTLESRFRDWLIEKRNYSTEKAKNRLLLLPTIQHNLQDPSDWNSAVQVYAFFDALLDRINKKISKMLREGKQFPQGFALAAEDRQPKRPQIDVDAQVNKYQEPLRLLLADLNGLKGEGIFSPEDFHTLPGSYKTPQDIFNGKIEAYLAALVRYADSPAKPVNAAALEAARAELKKEVIPRVAKSIRDHMPSTMEMETLDETRAAANRPKRREVDEDAINTKFDETIKRFEGKTVQAIGKAQKKSPAKS